MTSNNPAEDEIFRQLTGLPRSLSDYWASDRDVTGEWMDKQEIFTELASHLAAQQEHDRQEAFAQLNPDFGVLLDSRDPAQHQFAQQRERALTLGERVAAAELSEREHGEPSDVAYFPPAQAERATAQREAMRQRLLDGYERRQAVRMERAEQDRER
jgi:hypothetical protein